VYGANSHFHHEPDRYEDEYRDLLLRADNENRTRELLYLQILDAFTANVTQEFKNTTLIFVLQDMAMPDGEKFRTNARINYFNYVATTFLKKKYPEVVVWSTAKAMSDHLFMHSYDSVMRDLVHMSDSTLQLEMQFFLNYMFRVNCK
jgi:hypothetical protein